MSRSSNRQEKDTESAVAQGCLRLMLGLAAWVAVALLVAWGCRSMVARPILYGFFIATVIALPFLFPNFFVALGLLGLFDRRDKRGRRF